ncbi:MAG: DUF4340 domain-containing protein [Bacteroidia bacterium]|nr:DUF4340 domain-containing protein [Bacteroidia bacterium]
MKNKQTLLLIAILLLFAALYYFTVFNKKKSTIDESEIAFAVSDTSSIIKIQMVRYFKDQKQGEVVLERKTNSGWVVNGVSPAHPEQLRMLLLTISRITAREPVPPQAKKNVLSNIKGNYVHVKIISSTGNEKAYLVGGSSIDGKGTYMLLEGADNPYIVYLPSFEGYLTVRYSTNPKDWIENILLNASETEIKSVQIDYPGKDSSFVIEKINQRWVLNGNYQPDTFVTKAYFSNFGKIYAESYADETYPGMRDSLLRRTPDITFTVTKQNGEKRKIVLFLRTDNANSFFGWVEGENKLLTIQHFVFDKFLVKKSFFYQKPA